MDPVYGTNISGTINLFLMVSLSATTRFSATTALTSIFGLAGDDYIVGGAGADALDGGPGSDTASYYHLSTAGIMTRLSYGAELVASMRKATGPDSSGSRISGALSTRTRSSATTAATSSPGMVGGDLLDGGDGDDLLVGGSGNDEVKGGGGADLLSGGVGIDTEPHARSCPRA